MDVTGIGVVIPAYNAEKTIGSIVKELIAFGFDADKIIIVDDGSNDMTNKIATDMKLSVVHHKKNMGKGMALRSGFEHARSRNLRAAVTLDADGQHKVIELCRFLERKDDYDLIIGLRRNSITTMPFLRRITNRITSLVVSLLSNTYIPDTQCGFRYINLAIFNTIDLKTKNFQTESELVVKAVRYNYRVGFVPITAVYNSEKSYIHPLIDTIRFVIMTARFLWR
jgi:glycosyltransferase involved in cell wall biosynthesis